MAWLQVDRLKRQMEQASEANVEGAMVAAGVAGVAVGRGTARATVRADDSDEEVDLEALREQIETLQRQNAELLLGVSWGGNGACGGGRARLHVVGDEPG